MKSEIISLGGACDVGIALQWMRVKGPSYPFDWLANLDGGLSVVTDILENEFSTIDKCDCYETRHFPETGKNYVVYKSYPEVVHLHSDPLANYEEHEALVRRMARFRAALEDPDLFINFIFYRILDLSSIESSSVSVESVIYLLRSEGERFIKFIRSTHPEKYLPLHW